MKKNILRFYIFILVLFTFSQLGNSLAFAKSTAASISLATAATQAQAFIFPTRGYITQGYHVGHLGIDIANKQRPAVWAANNGTVIKIQQGCQEGNAYCGGSYGNYVVISHNNGFQTFYAHLQAVSVKVGDIVKQGQNIGTMGRTGSVRGSGAFLHLEISKNGQKMNPYLLLQLK